MDQKTVIGSPLNKLYDISHVFRNQSEPARETSRPGQRDYLEMSQEVSTVAGAHRVKESGLEQRHEASWDVMSFGSLLSFGFIVIYDVLMNYKIIRIFNIFKL